MHIHAKLPQYFRIAAVAVLIITVLAIGVGFYRSRSNPEFRMKGFPTALSKDVVASVNGYERRETDGDVLKYYIKADKATTFADNHQEMENVYLQVFDAAGQTSDQITAQKTVYIPGDARNFTAYLAGAVNIATRDNLNVRTQQLTYKKEDETASADEQIEFERDNVRGRSFGAVLNIGQKKLELLKDVEIETFESAETAKSNTSSTRIRSGYATYDQAGEKIELRNGIQVYTVSKNKTNGLPQTAEVYAGRADLFLIAQPGGGRDATKIELFDDVRIDTRESDGKPAKINSGYALYDKTADRFDLKNGVNIITVEDARPTNIKANNATYEQSRGHVVLDGAAEIIQGNDLITGDSITAELNAAKKLKSTVVRGNAYLRQIAPERTTEISGAELNAAFNDSQQLQTANALGAGKAVLTPANPTDYSKVTLSAVSAIQAFFKGEGRFDKMLTDGRTTIQLDVPNTATDSANKRVTADSVRTFFNAEGKDIQKAEAIGNAELFVEPLASRPENYMTTVNAPRFDCDFFPTGNNAKQCVAATKTKTVRVPTVPADDRGTQIVIADKLTADFSQQSKDVERLTAAGSAKFKELDRSGIASTITFTQADETVRLRGGEPTVWDTKARARASEIDWDTKNEKSFLRGGVSTTYYSQKQSGAATPFGEPDKPVFITGQSAEFDHRAETAAYNGNARGWQENNYVRGDRFFIQQQQGTFLADGSVQSLLYDARKKEGGKETTVPVYASSGKMTYNRDSRLLRYEMNVDIRQAPDRITGGIANVYLDEKTEVSRIEVENNVVVTQPNRRAVGDYARYIAVDESMVLRGNPARVDDAENGSSSGGELTVYMKQNRVISEGKSKQNPNGRTRSVYKVKSN